jgi:hypothetical protein
VIDVEDKLREELDLLVPSFGPPDWSEVLELAGHRAGSRWRRRSVRVAVLVAAAGAAVAVAVATPLGAAIADGLGGFSAWISGEPGSPAPKSAQQAFARANARSWLGFPAGTQLRLLERVTDPSGGRSVELFGFRSGETLCLRVSVLGDTRASTQTCAPLGELREAGAPVRVVLVDHGFGTGSKHAWYGLDRVGSSAVQVTAGIAADGVRGVILRDQSGSHAARAVANSFLYVDWSPDVAQRVSRISARTSAGLVPVPFAQAPFGFGTGGGQPRSATGPTSVQRHLRHGTIGWLDRHEPRGLPLTALPRKTAAFVRRHAVFGRVLAPSPTVPIRIAVTLSRSRFGIKAIGVCTWTVTGGGAGGGCSPRGQLFTRSQITTGVFQQNGSDQFATVAGLASDQVARITAFLADGGTLAVPLTDNAYLVQIARADFPARLVAYDRAGRIVGNVLTPSDTNTGGNPARGRAHLLLSVVSPTGATAELYAGRSTTGGKCMFVRHHESKNSGGIMEGCAPPTWTGSPLRIGGGGASGIWEGQVRPDVATIDVRFADGTHDTIKPTDGFILYAVPERQLNQRMTAAALDKTGKRLGTQVFPPTPKRHTR